MIDGLGRPSRRAWARGPRWVGRRCASAVLLALVVGAPSGAAAQSPPADIALPALLAVEAPEAGMTGISPTASPLRQLLEAASAGGLQVSHDQSAALPLGATRVTWTAWEGAPHASAPRARRTAYVYVFPHGQTPVGVSGDDHATAGNQAAKVVRDGSGVLHMAWLDSARPGQGARVVYRRAIQDPATGALRWQTEPLRVSEPRLEQGNSYVAVAASDAAIHFAWLAGKTVKYRRLVRADDTWRFEAIRDTGASGGKGDNGPDIAVRGDGEIHVLTPTGRYAVSRDGGSKWALDQVPQRAGGLKSPALAVDAAGNAHVVFTATIRNAARWTSARSNAGYWELTYVRRPPSGGWVDAHNVLAAFPEWQDPRDDRDILADWSDIAVDGRGNLLVAWHGTINTHVFGRDEAFAIRRPALAGGGWGPWEPPQALHPIVARTGPYHSFAPSLSVDPDGDVAVAVVFFEGRVERQYIFDTDARVLRGGVASEAIVPLSRVAQLGPVAEAVSVWFPVAGPRLHRRADGRIWLDVLQAVATPQSHRAPVYVVYQGLDVTEALTAAKGR